MTLPFHPLANIFPLIEGAEFDELVASIKASHGPREPIVVHEGMILDGRNRARVCEAAGVDAIYAPLPADEDPLAFVIDKNLRRRHLNESQRAMVAAKLANMPSHRPGKGANLHPSAEAAGALLNVSERSVKTAKAIQAHGVSELVSAVEHGHVSVSAAADIVTKPEEEQRAIVARGEKEIIAKAKEIRAQKQQQRHAERMARMADIGDAGPLPHRRYGVIYADPPWRFEPYARLSGLEKSPDNHYPTMDTAAIAALPVGAQIAAADCVLFLWATAPMLPAALAVMQAWDFSYKSHVIWDKERSGTGYWFRNRHELLLVGVRGDVPAPLGGTQYPSILAAPSGRHSEKPLVFRNMIAHMFPAIPRIELFARAAAQGWDAWGNEAPKVTAEPPAPTALSPLCGGGNGKAESGEQAAVVAAEVLELPDFLRRRADNTAPFMPGGERG